MSSVSGAAVEEFLRGGSAEEFLAWRAASVDALVCEAFARHLAPVMPEDLCLLAVGGYGRRQLFPYSDVDLLVMCEKDLPEAVRKTALPAFLQSLWDQGLRPSQSVHSVRECCTLYEQNLELTISLLDERLLTGDQRLHQTLAAALSKFLYSRRQELTRRLCQSVRSRHAKFSNTIYHLEPNVKESPGGLRDFQVLAWLSQLREATAGKWPRAIEDGEARDSFPFLALLRCLLHARAGRDNNVLGFDLQEEFAAPCGFPPGDGATLMRTYFRNARTVSRLLLRRMDEAEEKSSALLSQFRTWRSRVSNIEFSVNHERVYFRGPHQIAADPDLVMRLFEFVARHGIRLSRDAERRIQQYEERITRHYTARAAWPALRVILELPHADLALRSMHETGFLRTFLPEWEHAECLVVRDFYHRYTVDEHSLRAIQTVCELRRAAPASHRRFVELLSEVEQPALLLTALLLHDTGKGTGAESHAEESVRIAETALARIGMPSEQREVIRQLIQQHLLLCGIINSRDIEDPETARFLAERIRTAENLKKLTLLTFADISAVNPQAMTPWRMDCLWRAYRVTHQEFLREMETDRIVAEPDHPERQGFLLGFPVRYLRTHSEAEITAHLALEEERKATGVGLHLERQEGFHKLTVVARDRPFLFASICGALSSFGMNIVRAEAFANTQGTVLDTFTFEDPHRTLDLNPPEVEALRHNMERVVLGKTDVAQLLKRRPLPKPAQTGAQPAVGYIRDTSQISTVVEISAPDRPGLLYDLARTFSAFGCSIDIVLIDTEADRALDVFYVTKSGSKLTEVEEREIQQLLLDAIGDRR